MGAWSVESAVKRNVRQTAMRVLDISEAVDKYLSMTQICVDVALAALTRKHGSGIMALKAWKEYELSSSKARNAKSLVRWNHGGAR
jgi:hypothetical protein